MVIICFALLATLLSLTNAAEEKPPMVRHLEINGIHLFKTTETNYALTSASFIDQGWLTISVNYDQAKFITPTCQTIIKNVESLNEVEKTLMKEAYSMAETADDDDQVQAADGRTRASFSQFYLDGSNWWFTSRTISVTRFTMSEYSFLKNDDNNYTAGRLDSPNQIARIFKHNGSVTFVYNDLRVIMKPISCLDDLEQQLLNELEGLIKQQLKERPNEEEDEISKPERIEETPNN